MNCPQCGLTNPDTAQRCDCGYDFESKTVRISYLKKNLKVSAPEPSEVKDRTVVALWILRVSGLAVAGFAVLSAYFAPPRATKDSLAVLALLAFGSFIVRVSYQLQNGKRWAWICSIGFFCLCIPSPLLPIGVVGLWACLNKGTAGRFKKGHTLTSSKKVLDL